jgi:hypothetical protein
MFVAIIIIITLFQHPVFNKYAGWYSNCLATIYYADEEYYKKWCLLLLLFIYLSMHAISLSLSLSCLYFIYCTVYISENDIYMDL